MPAEPLDDQDDDLLPTLEPTPELALLARPASARAVLRSGGPRMARDGIGPLLVFWVLYKNVGLVPGILGATAVSVAAWSWERRRERTGVMATMTLCLILVRAAVGLISQDAKLYLAMPVITGAATGLAFVVSIVAGRPLAGSFAADMSDIPPEVRNSRTFRSVFNRVSAVWAAYLVTFAAIRLIILQVSDIDTFVLINTVAGTPLAVGLVAWSVWYGRRGLATSEEWGWAFGPDPLPPPAAD